jgi:galactokinase
MRAERMVIAPGRVNLLGEHVDYNEGPVLPVAIDRAVRLAFAPREGSRVHLKAVDLKAEVSFDLDSLAEKTDIHGKPLPAWAVYPAGVAWALQQHGLEVRGLEGTYTSDVPIGAGLSSSAAVEVAFAAAWQALGGWKIDRMRLAQYCQQAEVQYVGVNSGLMDQFASAYGVAGHALYFDTRSLEWQPIPLPAGTAVVIADSGVRRSLAGSAYNERHTACEQAVNLLRQVLPGIRTLRDVTPAQLIAYAHLLPEVTYKRARHVVEECARVDQAVLLLKQGQAQAFGRLMFAGHASLRDLYEVSCPELDRLVEIAATLPGCLGARLTGAGFGGCTVNLVEEDRAQVFIERLMECYLKETGRQAQVYLCKASQGAHLIDQ